MRVKQLKIIMEWSDQVLTVMHSLILVAEHVRTELGSLVGTVRDMYEHFNYKTDIQPYIPLTVSLPIGLLICLLVCCRYLVFRKPKKCREHIENSDSLAYTWSVFDMAKTAYDPGHTEAVIKIVERLKYDVNTALPMNGLTLFLCACLSGKRELINYMMTKGADIRLTTKEGDSPLYLATFGVLGSRNPDVLVLDDLIKAGCDVNVSNLSGYTPLHRAAGHGHLAVIQTLMKHGADPYQASAGGIYAIDSAINAGHLDAAELLKVNIANPHVWDVVDPHTPLHIRMGLQSPQRKHLMESSRRNIAPRIA